jgi:hypothetical protein
LGGNKISLGTITEEVGDPLLQVLSDQVNSLLKMHNNTHLQLADLTLQLEASSTKDGHNESESIKAAGADAVEVHERDKLTATLDLIAGEVSKSHHLLRVMCGPAGNLNKALKQIEAASFNITQCLDKFAERESVRSKERAPVDGSEVGVTNSQLLMAITECAQAHDLSLLQHCINQQDADPPSDSDPNATLAALQSQWEDMIVAERRHRAWKQDGSWERWQWHYGKDTAHVSKGGSDHSWEDKKLQAAPKQLPGTTPRVQQKKKSNRGLKKSNSDTPANVAGAPVADTFPLDLSTSAPTTPSTIISPSPISSNVVEAEGVDRR